MRIRGQLFLLKISEGGSPEAFTTLAGQRSTSKQLHSEPIETTSKDGTRWRELIQASGLIGAEITARGLIADSAAHKLLSNLASLGIVRRFRLVFADGVEFTGPFQVQTWGSDGEYTDAQQYELTLTGADDLSLQLDNELLEIEAGDPVLEIEGGDAVCIVEET